MEPKVEGDAGAKGPGMCGEGCSPLHLNCLAVFLNEEMGEEIVMATAMVNVMVKQGGRKPMFKGS